MNDNEIANLVMEDLARDIMIMELAIEAEDTVVDHVARLYKDFKGGRSPVTELFLKVAVYTKEQWNYDVAFEEIIGDNNIERGTE